MNAPTHTNGWHASTDIAGEGGLELPFALVFARTVVRYLLRVLPAARWELAQWRR